MFVFLFVIVFSLPASLLFLPTLGGPRYLFFCFVFFHVFSHIRLHLPLVSPDDVVFSRSITLHTLRGVVI